MQIFFFDPLITLLVAFALWFVIQSLSAVVCLKLKDKNFHYNNFIFKTRKWEQNGLIYERLFRVKRWKQYLPDGASVVKGGYRKRHLTDYSLLNLNRFALESARAELTHWLAIIPFWVFGFFMPPYALIIMLLYALVVNFPCIIAQRYNRPRIINLINKMSEKKGTT